jgi:hypothetical protein
VTATSELEDLFELTRIQHQTGRLVGNDSKPEFHAQTLPAGTAPADRTFRPNAGVDTAPGSNNLDQTESVGSETKASDTLVGATSADVHTGLGKPVQGQSSVEIRHDGHKHRKNDGHSLEGTGASASQTGINERDPVFAGQRALERDDAQVGKKEAGSTDAQNRLPETAETVAAENK